MNVNFLKMTTSCCTWLIICLRVPYNDYIDIVELAGAHIPLPLPFTQQHQESCFWINPLRTTHGGEFLTSKLSNFFELGRSRSLFSDHDLRKLDSGPTLPCSASGSCALAQL